jgi:hypothetical protein
MSTAMLVICLFISSTVVGSDENDSKLRIELEVGPVWQSRNDVQVPNNEKGTRFSLVDLFGPGPYPAARLYIFWEVNERHGFRLLLAPLSITDSGVEESPVRFAGEYFDAGVPIEGTYKFNSWRITYRYRFRRGRRFESGIGFTAKIRDAKIQLDQTEKSAKKTDVGFVPLLHFFGCYYLKSKWRLILDLDALAGGPGRAEDLSFKLHYEISDRWGVSCGYRTIEGGADVDEVYTFGWLHYAVFAGECKL